jgi:hypothetical protein
MTEPEALLRASLGVPAGVERVLIIGESSHWDTNWLRTSEEYFLERIEPILGKVLAALARDPKRVYCIESLFFFKRYWERHPEAREALRALLENRQLRLLASSLTTPDTLLPHFETILRDFQLGHEWLRLQGLPDSPRTAYFPDNFGHSPHLPSVLAAVGVRAVGLTRIDGMYFIASDYRARADFPRPGSTAALLEQVHRSHDFVWRDDDGAEVLCHWNAFTYFQGDMLAHVGIVRWAGNTIALPWRTRGHIARRLEGYVRQLAPFARTPYLFCPVGMDFNDPIVELPALLERYNRERSAQSGTWVVLGGLDDYLSLVDCHRAALPVLEADPNPYWMGFLATRPEVKQRPTRIARTLLLAEKLSATRARDEPLEALLHQAWSTLVLSNHHDYIPGTSPDRVWAAEQRPWLDAAEAAANEALELASPTKAPARAQTSPLLVRDDGELLHVEGPHYRLEVSRARGGCLVSFVSDAGELLSGLGLDLVAYHDEGGLWRLGHEYSGGRFTEVDRASARPAEVELEQAPGEAILRITSSLRGSRFVRELHCHAGQPFVRVRVAGCAPARLTVTCHSQTVLEPATLEMDTVGGVIQRPRERLHSPTFWAVPSLLTLRGAHDLHALFESPTAASLTPAGALEWIVARNALKERAFGWLPVLAHPIGGTNVDVQVHDSALLALPAGLGLATLSRARRALDLAWLPVGERAASLSAESVVHCDTPGVKVVALKRAASGAGVVVRLYCERVPERPVRLTVENLAPREASLCDALERPLWALTIEPSGCVLVPIANRTTSLRVS